MTLLREDTQMLPHCPRLTLCTGDFELEQDVELFLGFVGPQAPANQDDVLLRCAGAPPVLPVGTLLQGDGARLRVLANQWNPWPLGGPHAARGLVVEVLNTLPAGLELDLTPRKEGFSLAWITLSDTCAAWGREDLSGPRLAELVGGTLPLCHAQGFVLPDDPARLRALVADLALHQRFDLILSSGGTGVGPRDTTPEAVLPLLDKRLPGFEQAMLLASLQKTPHAVISRAVAGAVGTSLLLTLPGSLKAVSENLQAVLPALRHTLEKLQGDTAPCGG